MKRQLSSIWTPFYKVICPAIWIGGLGTANVLLFIYPDALGNPDAVVVRWILLVAFIAGLLLIYWSCVRIKEVSLAQDSFFISNYLKEIRVPLHQVERVSGSILLKPELVWIHFRRPTVFGERIVFMPKMRLLGGFSRHPIVDELRQLITVANRGGSQ